MKTDKHSVENMLRRLVSSQSACRDKSRRVLLENSSCYSAGAVIDCLCRGSAQLRRGAIVALQQFPLKVKVA